MTKNSRTISVYFFSNAANKQTIVESCRANISLSFFKHLMQVFLTAMLFSSDVACLLS